MLIALAASGYHHDRLFAAGSELFWVYAALVISGTIAWLSMLFLKRL
jgi:hypothetical protein